MDYIVRRKITVTTNNGKEVTIYKKDIYGTSIYDTLEKLEKLYKADRAMYRLAIKEISPEVICDNWSSDTAYTFCIGKVSVEAEFVDAAIYACEMFGIGGKSSEIK